MVPRDLANTNNSNLGSGILFLPSDIVIVVHTTGFYDGPIANRRVSIICCRFSVFIYFCSIYLFILFFFFVYPRIEIETGTHCCSDWSDDICLGYKLFGKPSVSRGEDEVPEGHGQLCYRALCTRCQLYEKLSTICVIANKKQKIYIKTYLL